MTLAWMALALAASWTLVSPPARSLLWRVTARQHAAIGALASVATLVVPVAMLLTILSTNLALGSGSLLARCGRLLGALMLEPWGSPELTISLALLALIPVRVTQGAIKTWRSQSSAAELAASASGPQVVVATSQFFAFTVGLLRPRVVVSEAFLRNSSPDARGVVLAHEKAHARGHHPLLIFVVEVIAAAIPLPPARWAAQVTRSGLEAVADDFASAVVGDRKVVARAIAGLALDPVYGAVGFEGDAVVRVKRLLATGPRRARLNLIAAALTALVGGMLLFAGGHAAHCGQESFDALGTAQCRVGSMHARSMP